MNVVMELDVLGVDDLIGPAQGSQGVRILGPARNKGRAVVMEPHPRRGLVAVAAAAAGRCQAALVADRRRIALEPFLSDASQAFLKPKRVLSFH